MASGGKGGGDKAPRGHAATASADKVPLFPTGLLGKRRKRGGRPDAEET